MWRGLVGTPGLREQLQRSRARAGVSVRRAAEHGEVTEAYVLTAEEGRTKLTFLQLDGLAQLRETTVKQLIARAGPGTCRR